MKQMKIITVYNFWWHFTAKGILLQNLAMMELTEILQG